MRIQRQRVTLHAHPPARLPHNIETHRKIHQRERRTFRQRCGQAQTDLDSIMLRENCNRGGHCRFLPFPAGRPPGSLPAPGWRNRILTHLCLHACRVTHHWGPAQTRSKQLFLRQGGGRTQFRQDGDQSTVQRKRKRQRARKQTIHAHKKTPDTNRWAGVLAETRRFNRPISRSSCCCRACP